MIKKVACFPCDSISRLISVTLDKSSVKGFTWKMFIIVHCVWTTSSSVVHHRPHGGTPRYSSSGLADLEIYLDMLFSCSVFHSFYEDTRYKTSPMWRTSQTWLWCVYCGAFWEISLDSPYSQVLIVFGAVIQTHCSLTTCSSHRHTHTHMHKG